MYVTKETVAPLLTIPPPDSVSPMPAIARSASVVLIASVVLFGCSRYESKPFGAQSVPHSRLDEVEVGRSGSDGSEDLRAIKVDELWSMIATARERGDSAAEFDLTRLWAQAMNRRGEYRETVRVVDSLIGSQTTDAIGRIHAFGLRLKLADALARIGSYSRADSVLLEASAIHGEMNLGPDTLYAELLHTRGLVQQLTDRPVAAVELYREALAIRWRMSGASLETGQTLNNLANALYSSGYVKEAQEIHGQALAIRLARLDEYDPLVGASYGNIGNIYFSLGEFHRAIEYYEMAQSIWRQAFGPASPDLAFTLHNIGSTYRELGRVEQSIALLTEAVEMEVQELGGSTSHVANGLVSLGAAFLAAGRLREAEEALARAAAAAPSVAGNGPASRYRLLRLAQLLLAKGETQQGRDSLIRLVEGQDGLRDPNVIEAHLTLSAALRNAQDFDGALIHAKAAMAASIGSARWTAVPISKEELAWPREYLFSLAEYARIAYDAKTSGNGIVGEIETALSTILSASSVIAELRDRVGSGGDDMPYAAAAHEVFSVGVRLGYWMWKATGEQRYLEAAYHFAERGRGGHLLDGIAENSARKLAGVPDEVLRADRQLQLDLSRAEYRLEQLYMGEMTVRTDSQIARIRKETFRLRAEHERRAKVYEVEYPTYFAFRHDHRVASVESLRERVLDDGTALVEYVVEEDSTFLFVITTSAVGMTAVPTPPDLEEQVDELVAAIRTDDVRAFLPQSRWMYRLFVEPAMRWVGDRDVIFAADGHLARIPFAALLDEDPVPQEFGWGTYPYMVRNRAVSATFSPTLLERTRLRPRAEPKRALFAMAPLYDDGKTVDALLVGIEKPGAMFDFPELPGTLEEVDGLEELFESNIPWYRRVRPGTIRVLRGDDATEGALFRYPSHEYRYVHMASHGFASRQSGQYSGIILDAEDNSGDDGILFASEVYAMTLNADLVTLSACESAVGPVRKGEGVIDLARAFFYAGARNALVTLWPSDDASSVPFMMRFYSEVLSGDGLNRSLAEAQRELIAAAGPHAAPRHWAPFLLMGR